MNRRTFSQKISLATIALKVPFSSWSRPNPKHNFKVCLNPGAIGISLDQRNLLKAAISYGYGAIVPFPSEMLSWSIEMRNSLVADMKTSNITWGSANLPVEFRKDDSIFQADLKKLEKQSEVLESVGGTRMNTWIMPTNPSLSYTENMNQHAARLKECAKIMGKYNIRLGLEYVGPKTLMVKERYPFIHTLPECQELIARIDEPNVGIVLDTFHWYCSEGSLAELKNLNKEDIVTVDLNDAVSGVPRNEQLDWKRELPGISGVIDIQSFLETLVAIGYDGPVRSEPFNEKLNSMKYDEAMKFNKKALDDVLAPFK